ncbi:hypothetical protein IAR50_003418 [Cryptococcus sp. DSM 104548]
MAKHLFAAFDVTTQVFYRSKLSFGIVNLKPLLPGHVLICPSRVVPRLADLNTDEVSDLFTSVQYVGKVLEGVYKAQALTISLQDGAVAGQSVPHVHVHIMPRHPTDYNGDNDQVYPLLEKSEADLGNHLVQSQVPQIDGPGTQQGKAREGRWASDEDRKPRTMEEMEKEAKWLANFF